MEFVRSQRASPEHDPNTRHVIYGLVCGGNQKFRMLKSLTDVR